MRTTRLWWLLGATPVLSIFLLSMGCHNTPVDNSDFANGPAPLRMPSPAKQVKNCSYEDSLTGGQVFAMYCNYCHNAPTLAERPFSNFQNVATHMRDRANLTGKEYAKLIEFMQRWNDVPPPHPPTEPSPKKFIFSQPIQELRDKSGDQKSSPGSKTEQLPEPKVAPKEAAPNP